MINYRYYVKVVPGAEDIMRAIIESFGRVPTIIEASAGGILLIEVEPGMEPMVVEPVISVEPTKAQTIADHQSSIRA